MTFIYSKTYRILFLFLCFTLTQIGYSQFTVPDKPSFQTSVYDYANILSREEKSDLEQKLIRYSDTTSTQIVIVTVATIKGENIGLLSAQWAQKWGVGQKNEDNGVFILLAEQERSIWISPGYGVEDKLTAGVVGELTRNIIIPEFKAGSYYNGLDKGTKAIFEILKGTYKGSRQQGDFPLSGEILFFIIIVIVMFFILSKNNKGGGNSGNRGGFDLSDFIILSSLGRGGFGGGSSGGFGGGGGGFGGGGFSGGGAGGSW